jgi:hypothetical protein
MAGERLIRPETGGGHDGVRLTRGWRLKELLTAGPHLSASGAKRKGGEAVLGRRGRQAGPLGPSARAWEKEKAAGLGLVHGLKKNVGPAGEKRGRGRGKRISFFF